MKVAVIGPVSRDINVINGKKFFSTGGVTYYSGNALHCLGAGVTVLGSYGKDDDYRKDFLPKFVHIPSIGTIRYFHEYPDPDNPNLRIQRAEVPDNLIAIGDIPSNITDYDFVVLSFLHHNNFNPDLVRSLVRKSNLVLSIQGMLRHLDGDKIIWKKPNQRDLEEIISDVGYIALDEKELLFLAGSQSVESGARKLQERGARNIIVTQGSHGSWLFLEDNPYHISSFKPSKIVDATGAGDTYLAGFIIATELFSDPKKQGEFAAMCATMKLEQQGSLVASREDVLKRLE